MSTKRDALILKADRGERVAAVRQSLGMTGDDFANALASRLGSLGVPGRYDKYKVSRMESGERKLTVEEAAVIADLDPEARGIVWLVFGDIVKTAGKGMFRKVDPK